MTDKIKDIINNFSDMKIIKALECCIIGDCDNCPFYETRELCPKLILFVSDLIKRQEAEVERLRKIVGFTPARGSGKSPFLNAVLDNVRAEAYREFAERLKKEINVRTTFSKEQDKNVLIYIDNILKELVGEDDG